MANDTVITLRIRWWVGYALAAVYLAELVAKRLINRFGLKVEPVAGQNP